MAKKLIPHRDRYKFDDFMRSIMELNFEEMFAAIDRECQNVERSMTGRGGPQARADGGAQYVAGLKRIANFFHTGIVPPACNLGERGFCREIARRLVAKGKLKAVVLDQFQ